MYIPPVVIPLFVHDISAPVRLLVCVCRVPCVRSSDRTCFVGHFRVVDRRASGTLESTLFAQAHNLCTYIRGVGGGLMRAQNVRSLGQRFVLNIYYLR